jgi:hypothetical protein
VHEHRVAGRPLDQGSGCTPRPARGSPACTSQ